MHFAHPIAVIISRPLVLAVTDRSVRPLDLIVALPFIGITSGLWLGVVMYMLVQGLAIRMLANAQAALPTLSANRANHWWSVIFIAAMTSSLVGSTSRRVKRIAVLFAFFPPRSETSRRFLCLCRPAPLDSAWQRHSPECACASDEYKGVTATVPGQARLTARLCRCHVT